MLDFSRPCDQHLINEGVVVDGDSVTVMWEGTGPSSGMPVTEFTCTLLFGGQITSTVDCE